MVTEHNNLRLHRSKSSLTQSDVAFLMELADYANVSRWEMGLKAPWPEVLLAYRLLFATPVESLFERQNHELAESLSKRIPLLLTELKGLSYTPKIGERIAFLESVLTRLTA